MAVVRGFVVFLKYDITGFGGLRNALLRWRYLTILMPQKACDIFGIHYDIYSGRPALRSASKYNSNSSLSLYGIVNAN